MINNNTKNFMRWIIFDNVLSSLTGYHSFPMEDGLAIVGRENDKPFLVTTLTRQTPQQYHRFKQQTPFMRLQKMIELTRYHA